MPCTNKHVFGRIDGRDAAVMPFEVQARGGEYCRTSCRAASSSRTCFRSRSDSACALPFRIASASRNRRRPRRRGLAPWSDRPEHRNEWRRAEPAVRRPRRRAEPLRRRARSGCKQKIAPAGGTRAGNIPSLQSQSSFSAALCERWRVSAATMPAIIRWACSSNTRVGNVLLTTLLPDGGQASVEPWRRC